MNKRFGINLLAVWINHGLGIASGLVLTPLILNRIGDANYGLWLFIGSIFAYSGLLNLGFGRTVSRYVASYHARSDWIELNRIVSVTMAVYLVMAIIALLGTCILAVCVPYVSTWSNVPVHTVRLVLMLLGFNVAMGLVGGVFGGVIIGLQRMHANVYIAICCAACRLLLTFFCVGRESPLITLAWIQTAITVIEQLGYLLIARRACPELRISLHLVNRKTLRDCASFSSFSFLNTLAEQLIHATDTFLIGLLLGPEAVVPYHIASRLTFFVSVPVQYIGFIAMPRSSELSASNCSEELKQLVIRSICLSILLIVSAFIGTGFLGQQLIRAWVGAGFEQSHLLLIVLLGSRIVSTPAGILRNILFGMGDIRRPTMIYLGEAFANLLLSLLLIKPFGILGVAFGTLGSAMLFELFLFLPHALHVLRIKPARMIRQSLSPTLLPLSALVIYCVLLASAGYRQTDWPSLILHSVGGTLVVLAVLAGTMNCRWFVSISKPDRV